MKRLLTFFALLAVSGLTWASGDNTLDPPAVHDYTDKSIYYLSQLFGTVGGVLTGQGSQMMGQIFYKLNWGIFLLSGVVVMYAVILMAIRLSGEGTAMGQGKSAMFSLVKLGVGILLIVPNSSTGYSALQNIVMTVVVKGVALADSIWDYGLKYLEEGGVIWSAPDPDSNGGNSRYDGIITDPNTDALVGADTALASQVFTSAVCMIGSRDPLTASSSTNRPHYEVQINQDNLRYEFPGLTDKDSSGHSCGEISWEMNGACNSGGDTVACATAQGALGSLINLLLPAAKNYYCMKADPDSEVCKSAQPYDNLNEDLSPVLFNSMMTYYPSIKVYADMKASDMSNSSKNFINQAKTEGWLMAGRYYWNMMQFINQSEAVDDLSKYTVPLQSIVAPSAEGLGATDTLKNIVNSAAKDFSDVSKSDNYKDYVNSVYNQSGGSNPSTDGGSDGYLIDNNDAAALTPTVLAPGVAGTFIATIMAVDAIGDMFKSFGKENFNPIEFMYKLGKKCLKATIVIWIAGAVMISGNVLAGSVCSASNPYGFAVQAVADWVRPIFMMIAAAFWAAGFFLSYYVPLYPYMTFLFASVGWFISVIEAMVAAPLVALGLTHPEDHDLLGKAQQAVMLLLSVFLQPSLLVVGLVAGMIFCYVSFQILIYTFSGFVLDVMRESSQLATNSNILAAVKGSQLYADASLLIQPLLIVAFCSIAYVLLTQSFSLIYVLRDNVMRWIGAPGTGLANPEQLTGEIKGVMSGFGKQMGDAASQGPMGASRGALDTQQQVAEMYKKNKPEDARSDSAQDSSSGQPSQRMRGDGSEEEGGAPVASSDSGSRSRSASASNSSQTNNDDGSDGAPSGGPTESKGEDED